MRPARAPVLNSLSRIKRMQDTIRTAGSRYFKIPNPVTLNSRRKSDLTNRHRKPAVLQRS